MSRLFRTGAALALLATAAATARAQSSNIHFNIAAGATFPTSPFSDYYDTGYNLVAGIGMTPQGSPLGFRVEGLYNEFAQKREGDKARVGGGTANVVYNLISPNSAQSNTLYLIGGLGYYSTREPTLFFDPESESNIGYNIGAGFKFPLTGFSVYVEARYHTVSNTDVRFIPVSVGLSF
jgi:hypothetical protein